MPYCSGYNVSFNQWLYMNIIKDPLFLQGFYFKELFGAFEFPLFSKAFFEKLKPEYWEQFKRVTMA